MGRYIALPIVRDPAEAEEQQHEVVRQQFPDWQPRADPFTIALRTAAVLYADVAELATRMGEEGFRYFGRGVANLPPGVERPAVGTVRITAQDDDGPYLVPEALELVGRGALGESVAFRTLAAAVIPSGAQTVDVTVEAAEAGVEANGVSGAAEFSEYLDYLTSVEFIGSTAQGADREDDAAYLGRLSEELELQTPRPILPHHFATLARRFGAYRATAIDGLNPADGTTGNRAMVAVAMIDPAGNPLPAGDLASIAQALLAMREVGFAVPVLDPTYTTIDVAYTATAYPGWNPVEVNAAAAAQIAAYLDPATWGALTDTGEERLWLNDPMVRYLELAEQLQRVEGLRYVDDLTFGVQGDPLGTANVVLAGLAPLPRAGNIAGVVAAG